MQQNHVYPLADADQTIFETLYAGPLQAAFSLRFTGWDAGTQRKNGSETIRITKGDFFYENEITIPLNSDQQLVAGIANFGIDTVVYKKHNAVYSSVSTYGNQAEGTQTRLGLALLFASAGYAGNRTADTVSSIPNTTYVVLGGGGKRVIRFFACWEKTDPRFATRRGFEAYLQSAADALADPLEIKPVHQKL